MRMIIRRLGATLLALFSAIVLAVSWTTTTAVQLAATALIMGGTEHPLSTAVDGVPFVENYLQHAVDEFINKAAAAPSGTGNDPIATVGAGDDRYAVITPEQFFPVAGLQTFDASVTEGLANLNRCVDGDAGCAYNHDLTDPPSPAAPPDPADDFVIFGYSQSAVIASKLKQELIDNPGENPGGKSFFMLANPTRPNGGFLSRGPEGLSVPILGVTFTRATPTNSCEVGSCLESVDLAAQYDGLGGDAAVGLTNVLAVANAALGYYYLHGALQNASFDDALYQGSYGDTDYYLIPTPRLPVLLPFSPIIPSPILTALDEPLRALIEGGYARDINPGIPTGVSLLPFRDPIGTVINVLVAIPTGIDDAIAEATGNPAFRPLGTQPVTGPFGVGGPQLPDAPSDTNLSALAASAKAGDNQSADLNDTAIKSLGAVDGAVDKDTSAIADGNKKTIDDARKDESVEAADAQTTDVTAGTTTAAATSSGAGSTASASTGSTQQPAAPSATDPQDSGSGDATGSTAASTGGQTAA